MNKIAKKLLAAALCLAMAATLLPAVALEADATGIAPDAGILLLEEKFDSQGSWTLNGQTKQITFTDGVLSTPVTSSVSTYLEYTLSGLGIKSTSAKPAVLCMEYSVSAPTNQYWARLSVDSDSPKLTADTERSDASATGIGKTTTAAFETHYLYYTVAAGSLDAVTFRIGGYKGAEADTVKFDYVKLYLVTDAATALASDNGYAKLSADVDLGGSLTLGENAVLDLNGHTLTAGNSVNGGLNSVIIDSSAEKTGKLVTEVLLLDNKNSPQLPLKASTGYVFAEPKLNEDGTQRAIMSGLGADGFTLDFRPGFGQSVRENILSRGTSGVEMMAYLSWTDIYGHVDTLESGLNGTDIFDHMYETATARGRLKVVGAEQYKDISLVITLKSCGVEFTFDPVVFSNTYVTTHFAADFDANSETTLTSTYAAPTGVNVGQIKSFNSSVIGGGELKTLGTNVIKLSGAIAAGNGKQLVIELDIKTVAGNDKIAVRAHDGNGYVNILSSNGSEGTSTANTKNFYSSKDFKLTEADNYAKIRMEIDLGTGEFALYRNGIKTSKTATYASASAVLNDVTELYIREDSDDAHYIDNLLIYTVQN